MIMLDRWKELAADSRMDNPRLRLASHWHPRCAGISSIAWTGCPADRECPAGLRSGSDLCVPHRRQACLLECSQSSPHQTSSFPQAGSGGPAEEELVGDLMSEEPQDTVVHLGSKDRFALMRLSLRSSVRGISRPGCLRRPSLLDVPRGEAEAGEATLETTTFEYGLNLPVPINDLEITEAGIGATLSFLRVFHHTFVPWEAVVHILRPPREIVPPVSPSRGIVPSFRSSPERESVNG